MLRVTAAEMARGLGGWKFSNIPFQDGKFASLVFMTLKPVRPNGHVGLLVDRVVSDESHMAHASSRYGFVKVEVSKESPNRLYFKITVLKDVSK